MANKFIEQVQLKNMLFHFEYIFRLIFNRIKIDPKLGMDKSSIPVALCSEDFQM